MAVNYEVGGRKQRAGPHWYRGENTNFNPGVANMRSPQAIDEFILAGWLPSEPFIAPETNVTAFGSCFASHISDYLNSRRYNVLTKSDENAYVVKMGEGIVNSYAIRQQFDWAFRGLTPTTELWHGYQTEEYGYDEEVRLTTLKLFEKTDVFILTFGLSEVWYDEPTGEVFWRAVPAEVFDPTRHKFRVTTVAENKANMRAIYDTIREFRPEARIIFTLSPIPLVATFRPVSCLTANAVSKAVLRSAIDEFYAEVADEGKLYYWPSYEIVEQAFGTGKYWPDRRHIKKPVLNFIMALFETHFCTTSPGMSLSEGRVLAMQSTGELSPEIVQAAYDVSPRRISSWVHERLVNDEVEIAALVLACSIDLHPDDSVRRRLMNEVRAHKPLPARGVRWTQSQGWPMPATPSQRTIRKARQLLAEVRTRLSA